MTDVELENVETERPERAVLHREFAAELTVRGDGRTVDVVVVPYGEQITHMDGLGGVPKGQPYTEEWAHGAFSHQLTAAHRVVANFEHQAGIQGIVGHGAELVERDDGLYGSFRIHDTQAGETALVLIREKVLTGVSLEAIPRKHIRTAAGVVRRVKADLVGLAFTRFGAYKGATVLAVREEAVFDEELLPVVPDPELVERCRRLGIKIPQRYQAHPDDTTDTPADADTSESDGTRQPDTTTLLEEA